jgi:hypothetical protein
MTVFDRSATYPPTVRSVAALTIWLCLALPAWAEHLDPSAVNNAQFSFKAVGKDKPDPAVVKAEILLDRARFSPGEIDG